MSLLFERVRLQQHLKRLYDDLPRDQADAVVARAVEQARATHLKIQPQPVVSDRSTHAQDSNKCD